MDLKKIVRQRIASQEDEMKEHFDARTKMHIGLVNKYLVEIASLCLPEIDNDLLFEDSHDASKFEEPEYTPYLHVNWKHKMRDEGKTYSPSKEIEDSMHFATYHHVKNNKHHPEFWDYKTTPDSINPRDRDKAPDKIVDGTKMPLTHVAQMVADWTAVDEEKSKVKGRYSAKDWADKNVNIRWKFTPQQVELIYKIIGLL